MLFSDGRVGGGAGLFRTPSPETHASYGTLVVGGSWLGVALALLKDTLPRRNGLWLVTRSCTGLLTLSPVQNA